MAEKTLKSRVLMKNDTAENWAKGTNFAPKKGEIIVYNDNPPKIKVGDGETNVNDLPFITYPFTQEQSDKLATIEEGANKTIVDGALSSSSTNSVQNKAIYEELTGNQYTNYLTDGIGAKANYIGVFGLGAASGYIFQAIAPTGFGASQIKVYYEGTLVYTGTAKISTRASGIQFYTFTFTCDNSSKTLTNINSYGFDIQFFDGNGSSVAVSDLENYAFYIRLTDANDETLIAPDWWEMGYTLPTAGSTLGGVKTTSTVSSTTGLTATPIIDGVPYYKDTTYTAGSGIRIVNGNILNGGILSLTNTLSTLKNGEIGYTTLTQAHLPASSRLKVKGLDTAAYHSEDYFVPATRTVNGKAFSSDITLSASDVGAASTTHNHDDKYLSLDGGTLKGGLILEHTSPSLIFNDAFGNQWCDLSPNGDVVFLNVYSNNGMSSVGYEFREDGTFWCNALEMDTALSVSNGGTGATTAGGALANLAQVSANPRSCYLTYASLGETGVVSTASTTEEVGLAMANNTSIMFVHNTDNTIKLSDAPFNYGYIQLGRGYNQNYIYGWAYGTDGRVWSFSRHNSYAAQWRLVYNEKSVVYSSSQPSSPSTGTIWLKPVS